MNTFYHFEGRIFETLDEVVNATKNYTSKKFDEIKTDKPFSKFDEEFDKLRSEGCDIVDSIELAK